MKNLNLMIALFALIILSACKTEVDSNPTYKETDNFLTDSKLDIGTTIISAPTNWVEFKRTKKGKKYTKTLNYSSDRNFSFAVGAYASVGADNCKKGGSNKDFEMSYNVRVKAENSNKYIEQKIEVTRYGSPRISLNVGDKLKLDITLTSGAECGSVLTSFLAYEGL